MQTGGNSIIALLLLVSFDLVDALQGLPMQGHLLHAARNSEVLLAPLAFKSVPGNFPTCDDLELRLSQGWRETFPRNSKYLKRLDHALDACRQNDTTGETKSSNAEYFSGVKSKQWREDDSGKPIQFLHTSKTAGTFFCDCARVTGFNSRYSHNESVNCHFMEEDSPAWGDHDVPPWSVASRHHGDVHTASCEARAQYYHDQGIEVEGNENYLPSYPLCKEFVNVLFLRDPVERLVSHLVMVLEYFHKFPDMADIYYSGELFRASQLRSVLLPSGKQHRTSETNPTQMAMRTLMNESITSMLLKWPAIVNEYQSRLLSGYEYYFLPYGALTTTNRTFSATDNFTDEFPAFQAAKPRLHEFDHIFIVDDNLDEQLKRILGWDCGHGVQGRESPIPGGTAKLVKKLRQKWGAEEFLKLENLNQLDNDLITEAKFLKLISGDYDAAPEPDGDWLKRLRA